MLINCYVYIKSILHIVVDGEIEPRQTPRLNLAPSQPSTLFLLNHHHPPRRPPTTSPLLPMAATLHNGHQPTTTTTTSHTDDTTMMPCHRPQQMAGSMPCRGDDVAHNRRRLPTTMAHTDDEQRQKQHCDATSPQQQTSGSQLNAMTSDGDDVRHRCCPRQQRR